MSILLLLPLLALAVAGGWTLIHVFGYGIRDLAALGVLASTAFYLSRFDQMVWTELIGRPYPGFFWFLLALAAGLFALRLLAPQSERLGLATPAAAAVGFAYLAVLSGFVRGGFEGFGAALQILVIVFGPILVAAQTVDLIPRTREASARLRDSFVLLGGIVTPLFLVSTAVAAPLLSRFLGWGVTAVERESGFVRGWSPLGGPISTGFVLVLAYGLAMHEAIGRRRRVFVAVLVLIAGALLFTLSRSSVMMMAVFHVVYFWRLIRRRPGRVVAVALTSVALFFVLFVQLDERYSFERFLQTDDSSTHVRASSAVAALTVSLEHPVLGHGPGLLYDEIRTDWLDRRELGATTPRIASAASSWPTASRRWSRTTSTCCSRWSTAGRRRSCSPRAWPGSGAARGSRTGRLRRSRTRRSPPR